MTPEEMWKKFLNDHGYLPTSVVAISARAAYLQGVQDGREAQKKVDVEIAKYFNDFNFMADTIKHHIAAAIESQE